MDGLENVQGGGGGARVQGAPTKMLPLVRGLLIVHCPWAPEGLTTPVDISKFCTKVEYLCLVFMSRTTSFYAGCVTTLIDLAVLCHFRYVD